MYAYMYMYIHCICMKSFVYIHICLLQLIFHVGIYVHSHPQLPGEEDAIDLVRYVYYIHVTVLYMSLHVLVYWADNLKMHTLIVRIYTS